MKLFWYFIVPSFYHFSCFVQLHFLVNDFSEHTSFLLCADCDEIKTFCTVIVFGQPYAFAVMNLGVIHLDTPSRNFIQLLIEDKSRLSFIAQKFGPHIVQYSPSV